MYVCIHIHIQVYIHMSTYIRKYVYGLPDYMTRHDGLPHSPANRRRIIHHQTHHDYNELVHALRTTREYACN